MSRRRKKVKVVLKTNFKRKMTAEEKAKLEEIVAKEQARYIQSAKAGGIDIRGNYTALHYRWAKHYDDY